MTAIDKFIRLEAVGHWYEAGRQESREVIVSFGDATLQLSTLQDQPLTHWALRATKRIRTRGEAVVYSADPEQREVLEIEDRDMIRAISAVTSSLAPPAAPRKKRKIAAGILLVALVLGVYFSAPVVTKMATMLTPPARAASLAEALQRRMAEDFAPQCEGWQGLHALEAFSKQLFPDRHVGLLVFEAQDRATLALPSEVISLSRAAVEQAPDSNTLGTEIVLAWAISQNKRPLSAYIETLGMLGAMRALIAGSFPEPKASPAYLAPQAEDFLRARDHLRSLGISPLKLQKMAETDGIGLPLGTNQADISAFVFDDFSLLQGICAK